MKYEKPEIRAEVAAIAAVRGNKDTDAIVDSQFLVTTLNAYEADE